MSRESEWHSVQLFGDSVCVCVCACTVCVLVGGDIM